MKHFITLAFTALVALMSLAPNTATAQTAEPLDTVELYFESFYDDPYYSPVEEHVGRDGKTYVVGGDWFFCLRNESYQFNFDFYNYNPESPAGTYTEKDLDINFSWAVIPEANGNSSYIKTCKIVIKKEQISTCYFKYIVDAELISMLGEGGEVNGAFKLHAEHYVIEPSARYDVAINNCKITLKETRFSIAGKNDTMDVDMTFLTTKDDITDYYTHKQLAADKTTFKHRDVAYSIIELEAMIWNSDTQSGGVAYVAEMEILANSEKDTIFFNVTMKAPTVVIDTRYSVSTQSSNIERGTTFGDTTTTYLDYVPISATANYGYHFSQWSDGNTDNPRQVQVTEDKMYTAEFEKNTYSVSLSCNNELGSVKGITSAKYLDAVTISATPKYGYHFVQWSDGIKDTPRSLELTQDTVLTAEFAPNQYTITTTSSQPDRGTTQGDATLNYLEYATVFAAANYGYHFENWNDGNTDNPRSVQVTEDKTYTAYFGKNTYSVTKNYDSTMGTVEGTTSAQYKDQITLTASPIFGYEFVRWSDGNTANPRTFTLTQDTAFTAEFAQLFSGKCGDNLYWNYDETIKTISITGSGKMYDYTVNTQPWLLFQKNIIEVITSNKTLSIGKSAFEGCIRLAKLTLGFEVEEIGENAFAGCTRLYDIYSYPIYPPFAEVSSFANYEVYLYIPCEGARDYKLDLVWKKFTTIDCIGAETGEVEADSVKVEPSTNSVTITWPTDENADTYSIEIKRGDVVFCTLTFDKDGMLTNIAFAPSRSGSHPVTYAASIGNGLRFTVTSLDAATTYGYNVTTKDEEDNTLSTYSGEFTTKGGTTTDMDNIQSPAADCQKLLRDGLLLILKDGKIYNAMGQEM